MKPFFYLTILLTLAACKKEKLAPIQEQQMQLTDLQQTEIGYNQGKRFDLDGNGTYDVAFTTYHIGDPLLKMDKIQFCALSLVKSFFPVNSDDNVAIVNSGDWIRTKSRANYEWFEVSLVVLAQKNIPVTGSIFWTGPWRTVKQQFLPIQLLKNGNRYNGWVELTYDMEKEKIILHRAAISKIANMDITAGL